MNSLKFFRNIFLKSKSGKAQGQQLTQAEQLKLQALLDGELSEEQEFELRQNLGDELIAAEALKQARLSQSFKAWEQLQYAEQDREAAEFWPGLERRLQAELNFRTAGQKREERAGGVREIFKDLDIRSSDLFSLLSLTRKPAFVGFVAAGVCAVLLLHKNSPVPGSGSVEPPQIAALGTGQAEPLVVKEPANVSLVAFNGGELGARSVSKLRSSREAVKPSLDLEALVEPGLGWERRAPATEVASRQFFLDNPQLIDDLDVEDENDLEFALGLNTTRWPEFGVGELSKSSRSKVLWVADNGR